MRGKEYHHGDAIREAFEMMKKKPASRKVNLKRKSGPKVKMEGLLL
ncbi:hypothetical protein JOD24_002347 [Kroppenstedtia sanguinis]